MLIELGLGNHVTASLTGIFNNVLCLISSMAITESYRYTPHDDPDQILREQVKFTYAWYFLCSRTPPRSPNTEVCEWQIACEGNKGDCKQLLMALNYLLVYLCPK
jgi:hypothetical protein